MTELSLSATTMTSRHSHSEFMAKTPDRRAHSHLNEQCTCQSHTLSTQPTQPHSVLNTPGQSKKSAINIKTFWNSYSFLTFHSDCYSYNLIILRDSIQVKPCLASEIYSYNIIFNQRCKTEASSFAVTDYICTPKHSSHCPASPKTAWF